MARTLILLTGLLMILMTACVAEMTEEDVRRIVEEMAPTALPDATAVPGLTGEQGEIGPKGDAGVTGSQGNQGIQGEPGERGEPGIQGERGETGPTGSQGKTGAAGSKGRVGPMGPAGLRGPAGPPGPVTIVTAVPDPPATRPTPTRSATLTESDWEWDYGLNRYDVSPTSVMPWISYWDLGDIRLSLSCDYDGTPEFEFGLPTPLERTGGYTTMKWQVDSGPWKSSQDVEYRSGDYFSTVTFQREYWQFAFIQEAERSSATFKRLLDDMASGSTLVVTFNRSVVLSDDEEKEMSFTFPITGARNAYDDLRCA